MTTTKRAIGSVIISAPVDTTQTEATVPNSACNAIREAFTQLGRALTAFGAFELGADMMLVDAGIKLDVLDASKKHDVTFNRAGFDAFVRRAHSSCLAAVDAAGTTPVRLAGAAEVFAVGEERDVDAIAALFDCLAAHSGAAIISQNGELIHLGVGGQPEAEDEPDMEIDVARVRYIARIKTNQGQYDVPAELAEGLQVHERIHPEGVEAPTGAPCLRADRIDAPVDPSGELFDDSATAEADGNQDDSE